MKLISHKLSKLFKELALEENKGAIPIYSPKGRITHE
jgi:hypothetical protein